MTYIPAPDRYKSMTYRRCGKSGIKLPVISLWLWVSPFRLCLKFKQTLLKNQARHGRSTRTNRSALAPAKHQMLQFPLFSAPAR